MSLGHNVKTYNILAGLAVVVMLGTLGYAVLGPKPTDREIWQKTNQEKKDLIAKIALNRSRLDESEGKQAAYTWKLTSDQIGPDVLTNLNALAKNKQVLLSNFRPGKLTENGGLRVLTYDLTLAGTYGTVWEFLREVQEPEQLLAIQSVQMSNTDGISDAVTAKVTLIALADKKSIAVRRPAAPAPNLTPNQEGTTNES
jgi:Tfp pilus assembly protein PilO